MSAIFRRELRMMCTSMTGAVSACVTLLVTGLMFRYYNLYNGILTFHYAVSGSVLLFYIVLPVLAMRVFSEERKNATEPMLFSAPVRVTGIVLGKYAALVVTFAVPLIIPSLYPLIMRTFGAETLVWDYVSLLAFFLMGCAYLSVGMFISSCTENPVIAAIGCILFVFVTQMLSSIFTILSSSGVTALLFLIVLSAAAGVVIYLVSKRGIFALICTLVLVIGFTAVYMIRPVWFSGRTESVLRILDFASHFEDFTGGIFSWQGVLYFLSYIVMGIAATVIRLTLRRDERRPTGMFALAFGLGTAAVLLLARLILGALPQGWTSCDVSEQKFYTIGAVTREYLDTLDEDVVLYFLTENGREDEPVERLARSYADYSPRVTFEAVDAVANPTFAQKYTEGSVTLNSVIAVAGERAQVADYSAFYQYLSGYGQAVGFDAEGQITGAIARLMENRETMICYTTGHEELAFSSDMQDVLAKSGITSQEINLLTTEIPEDCSALVLFSPMTDLTDLERKRLRFYLENGGHALIVTMPSAVTGGETPNLDQVLSTYGITRLGGLVMEENASAYVSAPYLIIPEVQATPVTSSLTGTNLLCALPEGISVSEDSDELVYSALPLLMTSQEGYLKESIDTTVLREEGDSQGSFCLGALVEETLSMDLEGSPDVDLAEQEADASEENEGTGDDDGDRDEISVTGTEEAGGRITKILYFTTPCLFSADALSTLIQDGTQLPEGNVRLFANAMSYLTDQEASVAVEAKSMSVPQTVLPSSVQLVLGFVLMLLLPLLILAAGCVVWYRRRRR